MLEHQLTAYENIPFVPLAEGSPVEIAMLWGDPETGPAAVMVRFPQGYQEPWHSHSSTYHAVLVKGQFQIRSKEGEDSAVYGPGCYGIQTGGKLHSEANVGDTELVAVVYFDGPVDFVMES